MRIFVKSVMTGFAFSLGAALFRKVAPKLGLDDKADKKDAEATAPAQPEVSRKEPGGADEPEIDASFIVSGRLPS